MPTISEKLRNPNFARSPTFAAAYMREAADVIDKLTAALQEAEKLAELATHLTGCRADDDYVWGVQARIDAALSLVRQEEKG